MSEDTEGMELAAQEPWQDEVESAFLKIEKQPNHWVSRGGIYAAGFKHGITYSKNTLQSQSAEIERLKGEVERLLDKCSRCAGKGQELDGQFWVPCPRCKSARQALNPQSEVK